MPPGSLAWNADIADNTAKPTTGRKDPLAFFPARVECSKKFFIVFKCAELSRVRRISF